MLRKAAKRILIFDISTFYGWGGVSESYGNYDKNSCICEENSF